MPAGGAIDVPSGTALHTANHGERDLLVHAYGYPPEDANAGLLDPVV